ncbi:hypothetical protein [Lactiplantibacillus daowaiensis]|uniref:Uncharacterized protein n=1 Tax=Lactiplantibacillus daowaiensis TaxID=2559918 RepID=A0ABW1S405_9LACO
MKRNGFIITSLVMAGMMSGIISINETARANEQVGAYTELKTNGFKRNIETTGKYGLFTKPEPDKGAKMVLSRSIMKRMGTYTQKDRAYYLSHDHRNDAYKGSRYYFRAYGYRRATDGSIYYRVVTMNGKYRGYVYGGKQLNKFSGGVKYAQTTTAAQADFDWDWAYFIDNAPILTAPNYTQYKVKIVANDYIKYGQDRLQVFKSKVVTRTREGDKFMYVQDLDNKEIKGWTARISSDFQL